MASKRTKKKATHESREPSPSSGRTRTKYDLDELVRLVVTDHHLEPPLEERRDRLAQAFGVDVSALREGEGATARVLEGRDLAADSKRLLALPASPEDSPAVRRHLVERFEHGGVERSFAALLEITKDCIAGAGQTSGPFRSIWLEGLPPLAEYFVLSRHGPAVQAARADLLRATRAAFRSCLDILYPSAAGIGEVELDEEPYDPLDWF